MNFRSLFKTLLCLFVICLPALPLWARSAKPTRAEGTILAVDKETHTLVVKFATGKKPVLLEWNKVTEFKRDDKPSTVKDLLAGQLVTLVYREVIFSRSVLKQVKWTER